MVLCAAMSEIGTLEQVLWGLSFSFNLALVFSLLYRKNYRLYPCFLLYALLNLFQAVIIFASLQRWSFGSATLYKIAEPKLHRCRLDRKSTRLNSSHITISYAVFCLKKKKKK